ncbi:hypothetical protein RND71_007981 [Anisodus tanguticus]|uniref:Uncharacterized protein n=1 Tax=Anisodus tanguticus TaxID=243964 RepID=A0AAE1SMK8_9SOLA|nr:hypothetical protein RND71_007981 [Anisodus tanguticus]
MLLRQLIRGGVRPRFLIINDGWQQIGNEAPKDTNCGVAQEGAQFANRLTGIKENKKFQKKGLKHAVEEAKKQHNVNLLKLWNVNKCTGVVGVFNYQGAGWCKVIKKTRIHDASPGTLKTSVQATDIDAIAQLAGPGWNGDSVIYCFRSVVCLPSGASVPVTLKVLEYEVFHFSPVKEVVTNISFAPIGLLDMINGGGAVDQYEVHLASERKPEHFDSRSQSLTVTVSLTVRGCGRFGVYISQRPLKCSVDGADAVFNYNNVSGLLTEYPNSTRGNVQMEYRNPGLSRSFFDKKFNC